MATKMPKGEDAAKAFRTFLGPLKLMTVSCENILKVITSPWLLLLGCGIKIAKVAKRQFLPSGKMLNNA